MRSVIRVVEQLHRSSEIEGNNKFSEFLDERVNRVPAAREMFLNIAATASQGVFGDHNWGLTLPEYF